MPSFDDDALIVLGFLLGAFVVAVLVGLLASRLRRRLRRGAWLALHRAGDDRDPVVVTVSRPRPGGTARDGSVDALRLQRVDVATGRALAEQYTPGPIVFLGARGRDLWFVSDPFGLHARDAESLALTVDEPQLLERNPALRGLFSEALDDYRFDERVGIVMRDRVGFEHVLDDVSRVARYTVGAWRVPRVPLSDRLRDGTAVTIEGADGARSLRARLPGAAPDVVVHSFGHARLLRDGTGRLLELDGPPSVLLRHRTLDDGSVRVSRVAVGGVGVLWSVTVEEIGLAGGGADVIGGEVVGDLALLMGAGERDEVVCLEGAQGFALWRREV